MLNEHIELALRNADVHLFEIPVSHEVNPREPERPDGLDVAPEDHERVMREIAAFAREATPLLVVEYRAPTNGDGRVRWRQARGSLVRNEHGVATHLVGSTHDITSLKESQQEAQCLHQRAEQAETELRVLNEKLDLAMQLFDFRVLELDMRGTASPAEAVISRSWNRDGHGLRAITVASFIDHLEQNVLPEDKPRALEVLEAAMRGDIQEAAMEFRARDRAGAGFRWRQGRVKVYCDEGGVPERCITLSNDIQQVKTAEEEARRAVELLKLATSLSEVTVWSIDLAGGDLAGANATFINLAESLGYEPDEIPADLASTMELTIHPEDRPKLMAALQAYLDGRSERFEAEARVLRKDGALEWHLARGVAIRDADGRPTHLTGTSVFVTRIKQVEAELRAISEKFDLAARLFDFRVTEIDLRAAASPPSSVSNGSGSWKQRGLRSMPLASYFDYLQQAMMPEDLPRTLEALESAIRGDIPEVMMECRVRAASADAFRWRLGRVKVYHDENGVAERCISFSHDIHPLKTAEAAAQRAIQQLRLATDLCGVGVWGYELEGGDLATARSLFPVDGGMEKLGYDTDELPRDLVGRMQRLLPPEDRARVYEELEDCLVGKSPQFETSLRFVRKDGQSSWKLVRGIVTRDEAGRPLTFMGTTVDITQLKHTQDELQRAKDRLELALLGSKAFIWDVDVPDGQIANAIPVFTNAWEHCGYEAPSEPYVAGQGLFALLPAGEGERYAANVQAFFDGTGREWEFEQRMLHKDGAERWHLKRGIAERNADGRVTRFSGTSIDITDRKQMERELQRVKERLELAVRGSKACTWDYDLPDGQIVNAVPVFTNAWELCGYDVPSDPYLASQAMPVLLVAEDVKPFTERLQAFLDGTGCEWDTEVRVTHSDGQVHWLTGRGVVVRNANGGATRFIGMSIDITDRKVMERALQRVNERLELALLGSKACTWEYDLPDGQILNAIPVYTNAWELCGYDVPADPLLNGQVLSVLLPPEDLEPFVAGVQAFLDGPAREWDIEMRVMHKDGTERWLLGRGVAVRNESGQVLRFIGAAIDITDRKLMERALSESEERFRRTFENAAVGMILTDASSKLIEYNRRFCEFLGYAPEELAGRCVFDFMDPDEAVLHLDQLQRVVRGETTAFTRDTRYFRKDGAVVWGNLTVSVIQRQADGTPVHVMGIFQDITARKALGAELRRGRETLELAMRGSDISVVVVDGAGDFYDSRWTLFNFWEPMGIDPATAPVDFEGRSRLSIHPDDYDAVLESFRRVAEHKRPDYYVEHRFLYGDGSVGWRLSRGTILYDDVGNVSRFIATAIDITKLKQIESELSRAREAAEAANLAKDEFLAKVSHEIRTPMNAILGMTELVLDSAPSDHQRQLLSTVRSAAKNLLGIINDLLDFSKIAAGKLPLDRAPFSLRAAVGDTLRALAVRAQRKGLDLLCHVRSDVPDMLDGDAGRLRQVLMNLVDNAIKFTELGEVDVDVEVAAPYGAALESEDVELVFSVRDSGIGIAPDKQASIFQAFEQGDSSTTRNYGGTGLGLTIAAQLAALMDGSITLESAPGHGSKFRFTARFAPSVRAEGAATSLESVLNLDLTPPSAEAKTGERLEPVSPLRILVAEDNELNVALLEELLRRRGHHAKFARDGRAALDLALALAPDEACDLMLLDLHMPGLDGFQVARAIREHEQCTSRHLPIIALTARSSAHDRERCIAAGMDEFLSKPIEAAALWAVIERLVRRWSPSGSAPPQVGSHLLDPRAILRACDGQASLLEKILVVFRKSLPNQMSRVRMALGAGELAGLREAAHRLAGTVGAFSTVTADIALTLEDEAVRQDLESCRALVERLGAMCDALLEETATLSIDSLKL